MKRKDRKKILKGGLPKSFLKYGSYKITKTGSEGRKWAWKTFHSPECLRDNCRRCNGHIYESGSTTSKQEAQAAAERSLMRYRRGLALVWVKHDILPPGEADYIVHSAESRRIERPPSTPEYRKELTETVRKVLKDTNPQ